MLRIFHTKDFSFENPVMTALPVVVIGKFKTQLCKLVIRGRLIQQRLHEHVRESVALRNGLRGTRTFVYHHFLAFVLIGIDGKYEIKAVQNGLPLFCLAWPLWFAQQESARARLAPLYTKSVNIEPAGCLLYRVAQICLKTEKIKFINLFKPNSFLTWKWLYIQDFPVL